jgi:signal transduction histidine kinase
MIDHPMPGTIRLLRISVLLPVISMVVLGLTQLWQNAALPDPQVAIVVGIALLPVLVAWLPWVTERLGASYLPVSLTIYLLCQTLLTSLLQNLGMVRFDVVQIGPVYIVEPGVLLMLPLLLIAWQYGWRGALLASATAGTLHLAVGVLLHWLIPDLMQVAPATPFLRPDLLYFLPLVVAYLGHLMRRQQHHEQVVQTQLREYAARMEVTAIGRERHRLAEQLQGTVVPSLGTLGAQLDLLAASLGSTPENAGAQLAGLQQQVQSEYQKTRQVVDDLQAHPVEGVDLIQAIQQRAETLARRRDIAVEFTTDGAPVGLSLEQEMVLYHVTDRALSHIESHLHVQRIDLRLSYMDHLVALTVHDDGSGCRCQSARNGAPLLADIEASAQLIGGHLCIDNDDQLGTTIALWLPCRQGEEK